MTSTANENLSLQDFSVPINYRKLSLAKLLLSDWLTTIDMVKFRVRAIKHNYYHRVKV